MTIGNRFLANRFFGGYSASKVIYLNSRDIMLCYKTKIVKYKMLWQN